MHAQVSEIGEEDGLMVTAVVILLLRRMKRSGIVLGFVAVSSGVNIACVGLGCRVRNRNGAERIRLELKEVDVCDMFNRTMS